MQAGSELEYLAKERLGRERFSRHERFSGYLLQGLLPKPGRNLSGLCFSVHPSQPVIVRMVESQHNRFIIAERMTETFLLSDG